MDYPKTPFFSVVVAPLLEFEVSKNVKTTVYPVPTRFRLEGFQCILVYNIYVGVVQL